jgi:hypothetical protein
LVLEVVEEREQSLVRKEIGGSSEVGQFGEVDLKEKVEFPLTRRLSLWIDGPGSVGRPSEIRWEEGLAAHATARHNVILKREGDRWEQVPAKGVAKLCYAVLFKQCVH